VFEEVEVGKKKKSSVVLRDETAQGFKSVREKRRNLRPDP